MIYLDYNATTPVKPAVRVAMMEAMERHGNPSSVHRYGRIARRYVEDARAAVAALAGVKPAQIVFAGSGTESNNTVLNGHADVPHILSVIEHDSVRACAKKPILLPVTHQGVVDVVAAESILQSVPSGALVSVMLVNNETGVIQPVAELSQLAKKYGHRMHSDVVQAAGRLPIDFTALGVDFLTLSAHKIGGPQGIGALVMREGAGLPALIKGGGQEMYRRAGTENVPAIIGFGIAALLAADDLRDMPRLAASRDDLQAQLIKIARDDAVVLGIDAPRVANTLCLAMRGVSSETQVMAMDLAGVAVSAGAACSSGKVRASHVAQAMGYNDGVARSVLRISLGWQTKPEDLTRCADAWRTMYNRNVADKKAHAA